MKIRDYETELLEIERAYNYEQTLIKQCTEKLFEEMKEPMDFFIRKNFTIGWSYISMYHAYNFAINEVTDFKGDAISNHSLASMIFYIEVDGYKKWCKINHIDTDKLKEMIFSFFKSKYEIRMIDKTYRPADKYEAEIFKKKSVEDHLKETKSQFKIKDFLLTTWMIIFAFGVFVFLNWNK